MSAVVATAPARQLRRSLGPMAWAVLEDLALDAQRDDRGALTAATNVRRLAANLGVSKDAAARALGRLLDAGLVLRLPPRRHAEGTFGPICYRLCADRLVGLELLHGPAGTDSAGQEAPAAGRAQKMARRSTRSAAQAALFDLAPPAG